MVAASVKDGPIVTPGHGFLIHCPEPRTWCQRPGLLAWLLHLRLEKGMSRKLWKLQFWTSHEHSRCCDSWDPP